MSLASAVRRPTETTAEIVVRRYGQVPRHTRSAVAIGTGERTSVLY
jgi:hypothetical protein